ncbi:hypothetical protein RB200_26145 [Streptomyces sp. PmtG]
MRRRAATTLLGAALAAALSAAAWAPAQAQAREPRTERVSTASDGTQLDGPSGDAALSGDGTRVAFVTRAPRLGCARFLPCLAVKDLTTGALTGIDLGGGHLYSSPLLSADGTRVAFTAGKRFTAPYLHDTATGTTERLWPKDPPGSNELGAVLSLSPDGTHVAYTIGNRHGPQGSRLLYVRATATGTDELISPPEEGWKGGASVNGDGTRVAYQIGGYGEGPEDTAGRVPQGARHGGADPARRGPRHGRTGADQRRRPPRRVQRPGRRVRPRHPHRHGGARG